MTREERVAFMIDQEKNKHPKRLALGKNVLIPAHSILTEAPRKIEHYTTHYSLTIGIGSDHTATLIIDEESLMELQRLKPDISFF